MMSGGAIGETLITSTYAQKKTLVKVLINHYQQKIGADNCRFLLRFICT